MGHDGAVSIANRYELDDPGIESLHVRGFSYSSRPALGPPDSYTVGTGSFSEVKRPGRGVTHLPGNLYRLLHHVSTDFMETSIWFSQVNLTIYKMGTNCVGIKICNNLPTDIRDFSYGVNQFGLALSDFLHLNLF